MECVNCPILKTKIETLKGHLNMLSHYLILVLVLQVKEGLLLRKTLMSLGEIKGVFHLKLFSIIMEIRVTLGLFVLLGTFKFPTVK